MRPSWWSRTARKGTPSAADFNAAYLDMSVPHAAGGLYSTVEDLYRWDQALYTEQLVPQAALRRDVYRAHVFPAPEDGGYGYGWVIFNLDGREVTGHGGSIEGFSSAITRFPNERVVVIVLSNFEGVDAGQLSFDLADLVFTQP